MAQVFATLGYMFPNRVFLGIGRGEALNEVTSGNRWPSGIERFARLREALHLIGTFKFASSGNFALQVAVMGLTQFAMLKNI